MATTKKENIIIPEVMKEAVSAKIEALCKITPYAKVDTTLVGVAGDTVTVPCWDYIGDAETVGEGEEVGTTVMTAKATTFTIGKAMKSISLTDEALNSGYGNPIGEGETQLAKSVSGKVDTDTISAVEKTSHVVDKTSVSIGYDAIVEAVTMFEDEEDNIDKVLFIHPAQMKSILLDETFKSADKFESGVAVKGAVGKIAGCWVKKSKKVRFVSYEVSSDGSITITADNLSEYARKVDPTVTLNIGDKLKKITKGYYVCPIIKTEPDSAETEYTEDEKPAVTIFLKADTNLETERFPKKQTTDITVSKYYGVAMTNEAKCITLRVGA